MSEKLLRSVLGVTEGEGVTDEEWLYLRDWYFAGCPAAHRAIDARRAVLILGKMLERLNTSSEARAAMAKP